MWDVMHKQHNSRLQTRNMNFPRRYSCVPLLRQPHHILGQIVNSFTQQVLTLHETVDHHGNIMTIPSLTPALATLCACFRALS